MDEWGAGELSDADAATAERAGDGSQRPRRFGVLGGRGRTGAMVIGGLVVGLACGDGMQMVGDAMVDAGEAILDAGDAMAPDAQAQDPVIVEAECTITEGTVLYAEAAATIDPGQVHSITAVMCDLEGDVFGSGGLPCAIGTPRFSANRLRQQCGSGVPPVDGFRYRTVRFVIE